MATLCQLPSTPVHHLLDINGVAQLLGISRQGAYKLVQREVNFPTPVAELTAGRIWETAAVERWARSTGRLSEGSTDGPAS